MKTFHIASIVALASVGAAQLDNIPSCALNCFIGPLTGDGCSALTDFACHCKQGSALLGKVKPCVEKACPTSDQQATVAAVEKTCKDAGAPIVIDGPGSMAAPSAAPASAAPASAAPASAAPASAAPASAAPAAASAPAAVSPAAASAGYGASTPAASAASSVASVVSSAVATASKSHSGNGTASATATPSQFTGAAAQATGAVALIGAAALAMLAL